MRWLALVLLAGCATQGDLNAAVRQAEWCEANWPGQCEAYWQRVDKTGDSIDRRQRVGRAFQAMGRHGTTPTPAPTYRCHTDYAGGTVCDPQ
jgi:hypothetical protein